MQTHRKLQHDLLRIVQPEGSGREQRIRDRALVREEEWKERENDREGGREGGGQMRTDGKVPEKFSLFPY